MDPAGALTVDRIQRAQAGGDVFAVAWQGDDALFASGERTLFRLAAGGSGCHQLVHDGAILAIASAGGHVLTGGSDGCAVLTSPNDATRFAPDDRRHRWVDTVAVSATGDAAWAAGRRVTVRRAARVHRLDLPSAVTGLSFVGATGRLSVTHGKAVSLWSLDEADGKAREIGHLDHYGAYASPTPSPDGALLAVALYERSLLLWRLADGATMPLGGYSQRVRSAGWTADGRFLASAGASRLVLWPTPDPDSPMFSVPVLLAPWREVVTRVSCHPAAGIVAVGYADGLTLLIRLPDGAEIPVRSPTGAAVSALAWNDNGRMLAIGTNDGDCRLLSFGLEPERGAGAVGSSNHVTAPAGAA
jgi:WD40 repeat protein